MHTALFCLLVPISEDISGYVERTVLILLKVVSLSLELLYDFPSPMMASSNGNIFHVTGPLCGKFTGHRLISCTKASDAEFWCFLWSAPWINGWVNNCEAGDLRRHRAHYDATGIQCSNREGWGSVAFTKSQQTQHSTNYAYQSLGVMSVDGLLNEQSGIEMAIENLWPNERYRADFDWSRSKNVRT